MTNQPAVNIWRGFCPVCGRWIDLTDNDTLKPHTNQWTIKPTVCKGKRPIARMRVSIANVEFKIERK